MISEINLGKLAFYWRMTDKPNIPLNPVPDYVDFSFEFWENYQLLVQKRNPQTWQYLQTIYKENYNVGYLQEGHDLARPYGDDFLNSIEKAIKQYNPNTKKIIEIGAGGCYILKQLKNKGYNVLAIDPSPIAIEKGGAYGIEVVADFYPTNAVVEKADLMIHYDVLEHVEDPVQFLKNHIENINEGGLVFFAVPDCTSYIEAGDISMILHEHLNYFDKDSLSKVIINSGLELLGVQGSEYGAVLYGIARKNSKVKQTLNNISDKEKFNTFSDKHKKFISLLKESITNFKQNKKSVGFYIPLRAIPYLSLMKIKEDVRFFDDNSGIHNKFFDGFDIPVENFEDLKIKPVDVMFILSFAFGEKIRSKIEKEESLKQVKVISLKDILG
jgi:2-polyprenyl-3-methyl-5-hydroxy-6-metoxy-1,4-benzoquinol methylase